jgi:hypothetical protein
MKRSSTKNKILDAERRLAVEVRKCLTTWQDADESWREGTCEVLALWITHLLSFHMQLDYSWSRDRWLDGINIEKFVVSEEEQMIHAEGVLLRGLLSNVGGQQTAEPFIGTIWLAKSKRRPLFYELRFGKGAESRRFIHCSARSNNSLQPTRK